VTIREVVTVMYVNGRISGGPRRRPIAGRELGRSGTDQYANVKTYGIA
jgi:hypothetical protein